MTISLDTCALYSKKLLETDAKTRLSLITEIREGLEIVNSNNYQKFLSLLMPSLIASLARIQPSFASDSIDFKCSNSLLEIIVRLPMNDNLQPYVSDLMKVIMQILEFDNDDNAVIALRIVTDFHKTFKVYFY